MARIMEAMKDFFAKDDWNFRPLDNDRPVLRMGFAGDDAQWTCFAQAREEQEQFIFYSVSPVPAPADRRNEVAEFITRANYGMIVGNFEMDYSDGEIRYKTSIDVEDADLTHPLMRHVVYANVMTFDRYFKGLMAVMHGGSSATDAVGLVEGA